MKIIITHDEPNFKLPMKNFPNGCKIFVKGGCGTRGDGEYGGDGGLGEVNEIRCDGKDPIFLSVKFETRASDGISSKPLTIGTEVFHPGYKGGNAGADVECTVMCGNETETIYSHGGGGGGAGGVIDYVNFSIFKENQKITNPPCNGGANSDGILKYAAKNLIGGRGQDGDSDSFWSYQEQKLRTRKGVNKGNAEVVIEAL